MATTRRLAVLAQVGRNIIEGTPKVNDGLSAALSHAAPPVPALPDCPRPPEALEGASRGPQKGGDLHAPPLPGHLPHMMRCDAEWLSGALARHAPAELSPTLNLGASTRRFREVEQPYIDELVFRPLAERGVAVVHSDLKAADGVDIVGDVFNDADFARLKAVRPKAVICTHMFEHVLDREDLSRRLIDLLPQSGLFFVTVPSSYHEHHDPIDTLYRPTPDELASLFKGQQILERAELVGDTYWSHVAKRPFTLFFRHFFRFFIPFADWPAWKRSMRKLYWLFNPYKVAAVIGRKAG